MKTILAHISRHRIYLPFIQAVAEKHDKLIATSLHETIFDRYNQIKPDMIILPIYEYSQEFHEFINFAHKKVRIVLFCGALLKQDLIDYLSKLGVVLIQQEGFGVGGSIQYKYLYDSTCFYSIESPRNDKTLVILSEDNELNQKTLQPILYPKTKEKLVLVNNPKFSHPQNIGIANPPDLNAMLSNFGFVLDLDNEYDIEAQVCKIPKILNSGDVALNIMNKNLCEIIENPENYSIKHFIEQNYSKIIGED